MPRTLSRTQARHRENGFSMIEMIIAVAIMAILIIALMKAFGGAKKSTYANEGKTVGSAYMQGISQYHADFANRHPDAAHWSGNNTLAAQRGPLNLTNQPYMKSIPEPVSLGRVGVSVGNTNCGAPGTPTGATNETSWVSVCYLTEPRFWVRVISRKDTAALWNGPTASACYMGAPAPAPSYPQC